MRYARVNVQRQGDKQTVTAVMNNGGYFVHIQPDRNRHSKQKLVIRRSGKDPVELNGRQIATLKRVLNASRRSCE